MKKILLALVAPFVIFTALANTVSQGEADIIALESISQETHPYILYAKEGVQKKIVITSSAGEILEINYDCYLYYAVNTGANCCLGHYLIVKWSNGKLLKVDAKSGAEPKDLAEWGIVKEAKCDIPLTHTPWTSVDNLPMGNLEFGKIYVINTGDELKQHPYFFQNGVSIPDLTTKSILAVYFSGCMFCDVKSAFCTENGYEWNITLYANLNVMCFRAASFITYMFVDKIPENSTVTLKGTVANCTNEPLTKGNVLMLKVDYLTNMFEGGYEFSFDNVPNSFNVRREYMSPGDFGYVKFYYREIGDMLFHGTIHWMGEGKIHYPENLLPASEFDVDPLRYIVTPKNGFENLMTEFQPNNIDYEPIWASVQNLVKVREYLNANPEQKVKIFLYTPCVGVGNPEHWDWIIFLKKGDDTENEIRHLETVLGGCNNDDGLKSGSNEPQEDEVIISTPADSVHVFAGINYLCGAKFKTHCDIKNDTVKMYITDICEDFQSCYAKCDCYYTFDLQFERKGEINYKYVVELISPLEGKSKILSEGVIMK